MANCEFISACPFFNDKMAKMPAMANVLKAQYCQGKPDDCARLIVRQKLGKEKVPMDLYPNQKDIANKIISI